MRKYVVVGYTVEYPQDSESNKDLVEFYTDRPDGLRLDIEGEPLEILAVLDVEEKADADSTREVDGTIEQHEVPC